MKGVILASNSPRRRELLQMLGVEFAVIPSDADETCSFSQPPHMIVQELALLKGADVAKRLGEEIVISADTIVVSDGEIMGKPKDKADAKRMLKKLSAKPTRFTQAYVSQIQKQEKAWQTLRSQRLSFLNLMMN